MARQAERRAATISAIQAAGRDLFAARGFEATAIDEIAERAGVSKGAVYHHFATKEDVFAHVLEGLQADLAARVVAAAAKASNPVEGIEFGTRQFLLDCATPQVRRIVLLDGPAVLGWKRWREIDAAHFGSLLRQSVLILRGEPELSERDEAVVHLLLGACTEAALICATADDAPGAAQRLTDAFRLLLAGVAAG